ncbi:hypothetical protein ACFXPW_09595 [Streptomyces goshikiensis]
MIDTFKGQLSLEQHGGKTPAGVFARTNDSSLCSPHPADAPSRVCMPPC